jgi:hypothetical protein
MDKKIISICFLLIIVITVTVTYIAFNQSTSVKNQQNNIPVDGDVTDEEIFDEIDVLFLSEDEEIIIGEMV